MLYLHDNMIKIECWIQINKIQIQNQIEVDRLSRLEYHPNYLTNNQFIMNNIIRHINYEGFTEILGIKNLQQFTQSNDQPVCLLFITEWSIPSRLAHKRIKKASCDKKKIGLADVDLVDNIELCEKFQVEKVPHCVVLDKNEKIFEFVGLDIEKLNQVVIKYASLPKDNLDNSIHKCPNNHELSQKKQLTFPPYIDNFFYCNQCKKIDKCSDSNPVLNCEACDYDVCLICAKHELNISH